MIKVYCDLCGREIKEDPECEGEGIDWKTLQYSSSCSDEYIWEIEHICRKCEKFIKDFYEKLKHLKMDGLT